MDTEPVTDLDTQITAAKSYLVHLDELARLCLVDSRDSEACKEFRESISTAQLSIYQALSVYGSTTYVGDCLSSTFKRYP